MIYNYVLGWTYAMDCIAKNRYPRRASRGWIIRHTPGILFANRQLYCEAVVIVYKKPLRIEHPRTDVFISLCINVGTLRRLRVVIFEIDVSEDAESIWGRERFEGGWYKVIIMLASIWHLDHDLQLLKIMVRARKESLCVQERYLQWFDPRELNGYLEFFCSPLKAVSRVKEVVIEGDILPSKANQFKIRMEAEPGQGHKDMFYFINR